ncbi:MAG: hypothetical protein O2985_07810 [Proteobacteria bacterium]|nr:hypothetical protein [Pseudomonadota bacterium]
MHMSDYANVLFMVFLGLALPSLLIGGSLIEIEDFWWMNFA